MAGEPAFILENGTGGGRRSHGRAVAGWEHTHYSPMPLTFLKLGILQKQTDPLLWRRSALVLVPVHVPAEVPRPGLMHHPSHRRKIRGDVMLPAVQADIAQQIL